MTTDRTSHGARTLPGQYYTSQRIYDLESERIFSRRWLCVGPATSLAEPGSYVVAELAGESLIILKDRDRRIRAFFNVCRHRGTRLCTESTGQLSKYIVCPYHSWAYDLSGDLQSAPNMSDVEGFDPRELPLRQVAVAVWEGLIFVNLAPNRQRVTIKCFRLLEIGLGAEYGSELVHYLGQVQALWPGALFVEGDDSAELLLRLLIL